MIVFFSRFLPNDRVWRSVKSLLQSLEKSPSIGALKESEVILSQILNDYKNTAVRI